MRRLVVLLLLIPTWFQQTTVGTTMLPGNGNVAQQPAASADVVCEKADSQRVAELLQAGKQFVATGRQHSSPSSKRCPKLSLITSNSLELFFAQKLLNNPYVAHTLEVADDGEPLVVNLRQLDCTTLVETVAALTLCIRQGRYGVADYQKALTRLRYRGGIRKGYTSRLHYFSDWIADKQKMGLVDEVDFSPLSASRRQTIQVSYMSTHPKSYKALRLHPELTADIRRQEQQLSGTTCTYLPKSAVGNNPQLRQLIHDGDIIAITCSKPGLDIAH